VPPTCLPGCGLSAASALAQAISTATAATTVATQAVTAPTATATAMAPALPAHAHLADSSAAAPAAPLLGSPRSPRRACASPRGSGGSMALSPFDAGGGSGGVGGSLSPAVLK